MTPFNTKSIRDVTKVLIDYRGKTPTKVKSGVKLITAKVIKGGFIVDGDHEYIANDEYDAWMRRGLPHQWDILITTEAPLGEVAQLRTAEKVALAQRVILLRGNSSVISQSYFFHALKSPFVQAGLRARSTGTTVLGIKQSELWQVEIPCPPLPTQERIASILSAYDDLIENNTRRIKILEEMAQMIYREWFVKFKFPGHDEAEMVESAMGTVPKGWSVQKVTEAIEVDPSTKVPKEGLKSFVPMGSLSHTSMHITDIEQREGNSGSKFRNGDTLFARITPCLENGKTGFVQFLPNSEAVGFGSTEFLVLRPRTVNPEYVYLMARSEEFRDNAIKSMSGATGRQRVQEACFDKFFIVQPPLDLLRAFQEAVMPMFRLVYALSLKNGNLRQTRDLLLPKLISGDVSLENFEAEAASQSV
jgi:type I restriction enzyme, S subunit